MLQGMAGFFCAIAGVAVRFGGVSYIGAGDSSRRSYAIAIIGAGGRRGRRGVLAVRFGGIS